MARPKKIGLDYFSFDVDFWTNPKIEALHTRFGCNGIMVYLYVISEAYHREGYYLKMDDDVMDQMMNRIIRKEGLIKQVLEFLCTRSLLIKLSIPGMSDTFYTSPGIQRRYQEVAKSLRRDVIVRKELWLLSEEETASCIKFTLFSDKSSKNTNKSSRNNSKSSKNTTNERKGNEKKLNEMCVGELTQADYDYLSLTYGNTITQYYIQRTLAYKQCRKDVIERWIREDAIKRGCMNNFNNSSGGREYNFAELERVLMGS